MSGETMRLVYGHISEPKSEYARRGKFQRRTKNDG